MEKRTLLAIILSLLILYVWSALFPPPVVKKEIIQTFENKEVNVNTLVPEETVSPAPSSLSSPAKIAVPEQIKTLKSEFLSAEFSNLGGNLKTLTFNQQYFNLPVMNLLNWPDSEPLAFVLETQTDKEIIYSRNMQDYKIIKKYHFESPYLLKAEIEIIPLGKMSRLDNTIEAISLNMSRLDNKILAQEKSLLEYSVSAQGFILRKHDAFRFTDKEKKHGTGAVDWVGFRDKYSVILVKPLFKTSGYVVDPVAADRLKITMTSVENSGKFDFLIYAGPQDISFLKKQGHGFENIVAFSNFSLIDVIAKFIYWLISVIHKVIPNWGISIILISLCVYGATYPLTIRGMYSMKKMQTIQPEMNVLREKYKNNPQRLNKEVVELYKKYKVNPFSGCFLLILQMPIFIALYQVLWRSVFFRGEDFLWIKDLSQPDRLLIFPFYIPVIGNELNILPILMAIVMFFQQKISIKNMITTDPNQLLQQKMMTIMMPIFIGFIFYKFASGVALYFTMFYLLSTLTQMKMSKQTVVAT